MNVLVKLHWSMLNSNWHNSMISKTNYKSNSQSFCAQITPIIDIETDVAPEMFLKENTTQNITRLESLVSHEISQYSPRVHMP